MRRQRAAKFSCVLLRYKFTEQGFWLDKVNQWVLDIKWNEAEKLQKIYFGVYAKLHSTHGLQNQEDIVLHHFWINIIN